MRGSYDVRNWWNRIRMKIQDAMDGSYGNDEFSQFLIRAAFTILLVSLIPPLRFLYALSVAIMLWALIRCYSKNMEKRYAEREKYLRFKRAHKEELSFRQRQWADRKTHKYLRCKQCRTILRIPKGMGKVEVRCPKCQAVTIRKS